MTRAPVYEFTLTEYDRLLIWFVLARKPEWVKPSHVALMAYILGRADAEGRYRPKMQMLAQASGVRVKFVQETVDELVRSEWIARDGDTYVVNPDALPRLDRQKDIQDETRRQS